MNDLPEIHMGAVHLTVLYAFRESDYLRSMAKHGVIDPTPFPLKGRAKVATLESDCGTVCVICIPLVKDHKMHQTASLIAHEAVHIMQACRDVMVEVEPGSEWEAYTVQYVTQCVLEDYMKVIKRTRNKP